MSSREAWKADKRALKNASALCSRQRRNLKAYVQIIRNVKRALEAKDTLRALALVSGNIKYPPDLLKDAGCKHEFKHWSVMKCVHCEVHQDD